MPQLSDETLQYLETSPFFAMLEGKDETSQNAFYSRFDTLPKPIREFLLSSKTAESLSDVINIVKIPTSFHTAISKIVALAAIGDIPIAGIEGLLLKLNLPPQQSTAVAEKLQTILEPVVTERAHLSVPAMIELPPLTQKVPVTAPVPDSSKPPARNIIDLRKPTPSA